MLAQSLATIGYIVNKAVPANKIRRPNVGLLLGHRLRRWPNINQTLGQRLFFAGVSMSLNIYYEASNSGGM